MKIYQKFADYYDILFQSKNYLKECNFLKQVFKKYAGKKRLSVLDLGCGTGSHSLILAERGNKVTGVDSSAKMIEIARKKAGAKKIKVDFIQGDIRKANLKKKFDIVLLMFNVIGYQITNKDLFSVFQTAGNHLIKGGLLIFDCWFGPAVLIQKPEERRRIIKRNTNEKIIKFASPVLDILNQTVDIKYKVFRTFKGKILDQVNEIHKIRFLFPQEIKHYLNEAGFQNLEICPFMKLNKRPTFNDWNITVIAKKT